VVGGTVYGLTAARGGSDSPAGPATAGGAALTAVSGCRGLAAVGGTLERVNGTSLVIKASMTGQLVTVTTSASTRVRRQQAGTLDDITDGEAVVVFGTGPVRGPLAAQEIDAGLVLPPSPAPHGRPSRAGQFHPAKGAVPGPVIGTVTDARPGSSTLTGVGGTRVRVTTSSSTTVFTEASVGLSQLRTGAFTDAVGHRAAHATLGADAVEQGSLMPHVVSPPIGLGCSSSAIATAMFLPGG
jgi:hypothetical protein